MPDMPVRQPRPRFDPRADDPQWLIDAVRFHGHLGPWAVLGLRLGQAILADLDCAGYFDIRIDVSGPIAKPPPRCILDGLQYATGATMGKNAITATEAEAYRVRAINTETNQAVCYRPAEGFLDVVATLSGHEQVEALAREVARKRFDEIAVRET